MVKLNRTTEYALIAIRHLQRRGHECASAREIAEAHALPYDLTAKVLQRLRDSGLIQSAQGARGGYVCSAQVSQLSVREFLEKIEGPQGLVNCCGSQNQTGCEYRGQCDIQPSLQRLNLRVTDFLGSIPLSELLVVS